MADAAAQLNGKGNHSCDPNLWWAAAPYTLVARRDIAGGEELTNDYATSTGEEDFTMPCRCGTAYRRVVTGRDWSLPELQQRYGSHWVPGLLNRIRRTKPSAT